MKTINVIILLASITTVLMFIFGGLFSETFQMFEEYQPTVLTRIFAFIALLSWGYIHHYYDSRSGLYNSKQDN